MLSNHQAPDVARPIARDQVLDMVKGLLVVGMLVVHASNLFAASLTVQRLVYPTLLGFVSGSWLCISGYIIGSRYRVLFAQNAREISYRLIGRGWRLVAIFVVSNLVLGHLSLTACLGDGLADGCDLIHVFILGDDRQAFEVLLGIGYLLVIAPVCLWLPTRVMVALGVAFAAGLTAFEEAGFRVPMLAWMLACGTAGIMIGLAMRPGAIRNLVSSTRERFLAVLLALLTWLITKGTVIAGMVSDTSPLFYIPHVVSALFVLYAAGAWIVKAGWLNQPLTLMAKYSLLAYMGQMLILQSWYQLAAGWPVAGSFPVSVAVALAGLLAALSALSQLRNRFMVVDRIYLSVFG